MGGVSAQGFSLGIPSWHRHQVVQCKESLMRYVATMPNGIRNSLPQNSEVLSWYPVARIGRKKNRPGHFFMEIPVWTISCENAPVFHVTWQLGPLFVLKEMRFLVLQSNPSNSDARLRDNLPSILTPPGFRCKGPGQTWKVGTGQRCVDMDGGMMAFTWEDFQDEMVPERRITWSTW